MIIHLTTYAHIYIITNTSLFVSERVIADAHIHISDCMFFHVFTYAHTHLSTQSLTHLFNIYKQYPENLHGTEENNF